MIIKIPSKNKEFNDDVKSFSSQKYYYHRKLFMNKRSLDKLIKEKDIRKKLYNEISKKIRIKI